jgi:predicted dehydrogenase
MVSGQHVLIIGGGGIGKRHIRGFLQTGRARLSVVEPVAERRQALLKDYPLAGAVEDLAAVDLSRVDLAVICAPAPLHIPLGQRCADAGVSFLMEKPLSTSLAGVDRLIGTVAERRLVARVAYVRRASPETRALRDRVQAGAIGKLRMAYVTMWVHPRKSSSVADT